MADLKNIEVFATGTWNGSKKTVVDTAMLDRIVENFNTLSKISGFAVAGKLGHNDAPGVPAMGWVSALVRKGNTLLADFANVPPDLIDKITNKQYNSVSVEIWPQVTYEGKVHKDVLGAVAFLGAEWPAVKGLKPLSESLFVSNGQDQILFTQERDVTLKFTQEDHDALVLAAVNKAVATATEATTKATERAERAEAALKIMASDAAVKEAAALIDTAIAAGKVLPKQKDELLAMAAQMGVGSATKFKVGAVDKTGTEVFKSFLDGLPVKVQYGERGASSAEQPGADKASDEVDTKAKAEIATSGGKLNYSQAVDLVLTKDPALKTRYAQEG